MAEHRDDCCEEERKASLRKRPKTGPHRDRSQYWLTHSHTATRKRQLWAQRIKQLYKLTVEEYAWMYEEQGRVCPICGKPLDLDSRNTHVDHDHKTSEVRGLVCNYCNRFVLGHAERAGIARVVNAMRYLWPELCQ